MDRTGRSPSSNQDKDSAKFSALTPAENSLADRTFEETTGKLSWVSWVGLAAVSVGASIFFAATPRARRFAACAGSLAPCFLMMGIYNKLARFERIEIQQHLKLMEPHVEVPSATSYLS